MATGDRTLHLMARPPLHRPTCESVCPTPKGLATTTIPNTPRDRYDRCPERGERPPPERPATGEQTSPFKVLRGV
jgi:hypothetical protein